MRMCVIVNEINEYEYDCLVVPSVGEFVRRLHGSMQTWRVEEVRYVIDDKFICKRAVLISQKI